MMTQEKSLAETENRVPDVASRAEASAREGAEPLLHTHDVTVTYDTFEALHKTSLDFGTGRGAYRPLGLRKVHLPTLLKPHEP